MEDQPTDTGDLTKGGAPEKPAAAVPVGKRGGRHRTFRPRPVAPAVEASTREATGEATEEATEVATQEATEETATEETTQESVEAPEVEAPSKPKRSRWFRRRDGGAAAAEDSGEAEGEAEGEGDAELRERTPAGRRLVIAVAVAAALFVAAGAFGGAMLQPYLADRAVAKTKLTIARTATAAITTLFSYTPEDMDQLPGRTAKYLGGDLRDTYAKQVDALAATNKQNQIKRSAQVVGAAVESLNGPNATAIVYANVTYTSATTKDVPKIFLVSYRLTMQRKGSDWLITNMPWITSKDLTRITP